MLQGSKWTNSFPTLRDSSDFILLLAKHILVGGKTECIKVCSEGSWCWSVTRGSLCRWHRVLSRRLGRVGTQMDTERTDMMMLIVLFFISNIYYTVYIVFGQPTTSLKGNQHPSGPPLSHPAWLSLDLTEQWSFPPVSIPNLNVVVPTQTAFIQIHSGEVQNNL